MAKMSMKRLSRRRKVTTLSMTLRSTASCFCTVGRKRTSLKMRSRRKARSTLSPRDCEANSTKLSTTTTKSKALKPSAIYSTKPMPATLSSSSAAKTAVNTKFEISSTVVWVVGCPWNSLASTTVLTAMHARMARENQLVEMTAAARWCSRSSSESESDDGGVVVGAAGGCSGGVAAAADGDVAGDVGDVAGDAGEAGMGRCKAEARRGGGASSALSSSETQRAGTKPSLGSVACGWKLGAASSPLRELRGVEQADEYGVGTASSCDRLDRCCGGGPDGRTGRHSPEVRGERCGVSVGVAPGEIDGDCEEARVLERERKRERREEMVSWLAGACWLVGRAKERETNRI